MISDLLSSPESKGFCASQIAIITIFVMVSSVDIKRVDCLLFSQVCSAQFHCKENWMILVK